MVPRAKAARLALGVLLALNILLSAIWAFAPRDDRRDFGSFVASGRAANAGEDPYGVYPETFVVEIGERRVPSPNLNPPISVYPFQLLARVDSGTAMTAARIGSLLLFAGLVVAAARRDARIRSPLVVLWLFSLGGLWHTMELGQIYMPLIVASAAAYFLAPRQPLIAGLLIGVIIAVKPSFLVWPALLFLAGYRYPSLVSLATAGAVSLVPLLLEGPTIYRQWLDASQAFTGMDMPGNSSLVAMATRAGIEEAGVAASLLLAGALALWALKTKPDVREASLAGILGTLALGPITWASYALFALPFLWQRPWGAPEKLFAAMLAVPFWLVFLVAVATPLTSFLIAPFYGWALLAMLAMHCSGVYRRSRRQPAAERAPSPEPTIAAAA